MVFISILKARGYDKLVDIAGGIKALKETAERSEDAPGVIRKIHKKGAVADPLRGMFLLPSPSGLTITHTGHKALQPV